MHYQPRTIINGALMKSFVGQDVSIFVNVGELDSSDRNFTAKTTDKLELKVYVSVPLNAPISGWIQLFGVPGTAENFICNEVIVFEDNKEEESVDVAGHNQMIKMIHNARDLFKLNK